VRQERGRKEKGGGEGKRETPIFQILKYTLCSAIVASFCTLVNREK